MATNVIEVTDLKSEVRHDLRVVPPQSRGFSGLGFSVLY